MAKTMESKADRAIVSLTKNMLAALDDYRFSQRIATRSEAMRRLIEIGLDHVGHPVAPPEPAKATTSRKAPAATK